MMASTSEPRNLPTTIPFSLFVSLLSDISKTATKTRDANFTTSGASNVKDYPALRLFSRWVAYLRTTFEPSAVDDSAVAVFQLLFPDMDVRRKYDMQEARLAQRLARVFGVSGNTGRGARLSRWGVDGSSGCLGAEVKEILAAARGNDQHVGLSILQVDRLLTQLASFSSFSHSSIQQDSSLPNSRTETLKALYSSLSPAEASFLTQIVLKDLRPVLYPSKETHYTAALKNQKSNSVVHLDIIDALKVWDPTLNALSRWRVVSSFEMALSSEDHDLVSVGNPLQIPKTIKGTGCAQALKFFSNSQLVWAETKYDGERAQIHVKVDQETGSVDLKIFSKNKRESTYDRHAIHQVVFDALGLPGSTVPLAARKGMPCVMSEAILEAEMVAFSDAIGRIDEFWRIRSLVESTAVGPRHKVRKIPEQTPGISQCSMRSDASDGGSRHLALVFFDILLLDSRPLTSLPYRERRKVMETVVLPIPGFSILAQRSSIDLTKGTDVATTRLKTIFAQALADHQEGLVLKADGGPYIKSPWVKLKKDYIPGLGDCMDLVIVGACWEKDRGRELRVPPSAFTTFYLGMLTNADPLNHDPSAFPSFRAFFSTSYGLSRDQLEDLNFLIKSSNSITYDEYRRSPHRLGYDMSLYIGQSQPKPSVILPKDSLVLAEVFGAGFTKAPGGKHYELRFPRMTKTYRRGDRTWRECISLEEFQCVAREIVGRERPNKEADDWCKNLFGGVASPGVKDPLRKKQHEEAILADLGRIESNHRDGGHKGNKDHDSKKPKKTFDSGRISEDKRPRRRESAYLENVGRVIEGSPSRAVQTRKSGPPSPISPVTPTRSRLSRRLAPLGSMTNVAVTDPVTPSKPPLDERNYDELDFGEFKKDAGPKVSKTRMSGSPNPFVDDERGGFANLDASHSFTIPPLFPLSATAPYRKQMNPQPNQGLHTVVGNPPSDVNTTTNFEAEKTTPLAPQIHPDHHSQSVAGRSLPTPVSNGPIKRVQRSASPPAVLGVKRTRDGEEDVHAPSKKVVLPGSSPPAQRIVVSSHGPRPPETWSPDETTFMEAPHSARKTLKPKTRKGDMSVDAIKARLIRATSTLQILPSRKPHTVVGNQRRLEGDFESVRRRAGSSTPSFGIPAPFPPGTSGPGLSAGYPNNSDKVAAYHGADKFYSGRPPSATPPQPAKVSESIDDNKKTPDSSLCVDAHPDVLPAEQLEQKPSGGSKITVGRLPSFVLAPQQLLFADTAIGTLMSTSVVWFARNIHDPEPTYRPSSLQLVPRMNEVSQLESLLVACGWHRKQAFTSKRGIERGVIFIDYEEQADVQPVVKTHWVVQQCENAHRLATQYQTPTDRGMKPIWIVDATVLRWETLDLMRSGDPLGRFREFILWEKL